MYNADRIEFQDGAGRINRKELQRQSTSRQMSTALLGDLSLGIVYIVATRDTACLNACSTLHSVHTKLRVRIYIPNVKSVEW